MFISIRRKRTDAKRISIKSFIRIQKLYTQVSSANRKSHLNASAAMEAVLREQETLTYSI